MKITIHLKHLVTSHCKCVVILEHAGTSDAFKINDFISWRDEIGDHRKGRLMTWRSNAEKLPSSKPPRHEKLAAGFVTTLPFRTRNGLNNRSIDYETFFLYQGMIQE